jgi:prevent-host-death family protein
MKYVNATTARTDLLKILDGLDERVAITKSGQPVAVLLDFNDYRALRASQALASDPERFAYLAAMSERVSRGDLSGFQDARDLLEELSQPAATSQAPRAAPKQAAAGE